MKKFRQASSVNLEEERKKILTPYRKQLLLFESEIRNELHFVLKKFEVFHAGQGHRDLVVETPNITELINAFTKIKVAITSFSLWCMNVPANIKKHRCPHGGGGPEYKDGYLSPMFYIPKFSLKNYHVNLNDPTVTADDLVKSINDIFMKYFAFQIQKEVFYSPCLVPGFDLFVPNGW